MILLIILYLETLEMIMKALGTRRKARRAQVKLEAQVNSDSTTSAIGSGFIKLVSHAANGLWFQWSTYAWKVNKINLPIELVSAQLDFGVDGNSHDKLADRAVPGCCITYLGHWAMYRVRVH
jgi:hypothetical protein